MTHYRRPKQAGRIDLIFAGVVLVAALVLLVVDLVWPTRWINYGTFAALVTYSLCFGIRGHLDRVRAKRAQTDNSLYSLCLPQPNPPRPKRRDAE